MKGKFYLKRIKNVLVFGVLEMDERFRNKSSFTCSNGVFIQSSSYPEIHKNNLYLRGDNKERDKRYGSYAFENYEVAIAEEKKIRYALCEWAEKWKGWGEKTETEPSDVFEV